MVGRAEMKSELDLTDLSIVISIISIVISLVSIMLFVVRVIS